MLNFWVRLTTSKTTKLSLALYQNIKYLHDKGEYDSKWLICIKSTLDQLQMSHLWNAPPADLIPSTLKAEFEQKLQIIYGQQWLTEIQNSSAFDSYNIYKTTLNLEPYLTMLEPKYAIPMCKFRANNHQLTIVTGRYKNIDRSE